MRVSELDFELPPELIAQRPVTPRDAARLLVIDRAGGARTHTTFADVGRFMRSGDVIVVNDTRVTPARLLGKKPTGGAVELLLVRAMPSGEWLVMAKGISEGRVLFDHEGCEAMVFRGADGALARFSTDVGVLMERFGRIPLPPYIRRPDDSEDRERYQTVYARSDGAVAAPTAGLHFTPELMAHLRERGVAVTSVTLHVGPGTFRPIRAEHVADHRMEGEYFEISRETADMIMSARQAGGRVIAVGTTVTRTLETAAEGGTGLAGTGWADLFISPGYRFRMVDGIVTNFHVPRSTPLFLAAAVAGPDPILEAYREAVSLGYRFYSYGDAMLIL